MLHPCLFRKDVIAITWYYVDFENVGYQCAQYLEHADPRDSRFFIYYTNKSPNIAISFAEQLIRLAAREKLRFAFICCPPGNQSVDKHIIADVGMAAAINPNRDYIVITNDKGYMSPIGRISSKTHSNIQMHDTLTLPEEEETT